MSQSIIQLHKQLKTLLGHYKIQKNTDTLRRMHRMHELLVKKALETARTDSSNAAELTLARNVISRKIDVLLPNIRNMPLNERDKRLAAIAFGKSLTASRKEIDAKMERMGMSGGGKTPEQTALEEELAHYDPRALDAHRELTDDEVEAAFAALLDEGSVDDTASVNSEQDALLAELEAELEAERMHAGGKTTRGHKTRSDKRSDKRSHKRSDKRSDKRSHKKRRGPKTRRLRQRGH